MVLAVAFLFLVVSFRVVAALGRARLPRQVLHLWRVRQQPALHLLVAVARRADHRRPALFLSRRAPQQEGRRWAAVSLAGELPVAVAVPGHDAHAHPRLPAAECRIAHAQVLRHDVAAECFHDRPRPNSDSHPACAVVAGRVLAVAVKGEKQVARSLPAPRLDWSSLRASHRAWVCLARMAKAKYRLELLSHRAVPAQVCRADQVKPAPCPLAQRVGSRQQPAGCLLFVQPHALAEEYSSGSRL